MPCRNTPIALANITVNDILLCHYLHMNGYRCYIEAAWLVVECQSEYKSHCRAPPLLHIIQFFFRIQVKCMHAWNDYTHFGGAQSCMLCRRWFSLKFVFFFIELIFNFTRTTTVLERKRELSFLVYKFHRK